MATTKNREQQPANEVALFSNEMPEWVKEGQGRGNENVGTKDIVLPRLEIVQAQSPIKDTVECKDGQLFNSATESIIGDSAYIVPIIYRMEYCVWKDKKKGGGFFGAYDTEAEAQSRLAEEVSGGADPRDMTVVDTPVHYCLMLTQDSSAPNGMRMDQIVISMSKSKAKVSRKWNAIIQIGGGDRFSRVYKVTTFKDKNKNNETFFNYVVSPAGFSPKFVYDEALRLYDVFKAQGFRADHSTGSDGADSDLGHSEI